MLCIFRVQIDDKTNWNGEGHNATSRIRWSALSLGAKTTNLTICKIPKFYSLPIRIAPTDWSMSIRFWFESQDTQSGEQTIWVEHTQRSRNTMTYFPFWLSKSLESSDTPNSGYFHGHSRIIIALHAVCTYGFIARGTRIAVGIRPDFSHCPWKYTVPRKGKIGSLRRDGGLLTVDERKSVVLKIKENMHWEVNRLISCWSSSWFVNRVVCWCHLVCGVDSGSPRCLWRWLLERFNTETF